MATDISLSSAQQMVNLINEDNDVSLTLSVIAFSTIGTINGHPTGKNTELLVEALPDTGYNGNVTVFYNRNPLESFETYNGNEPIEMMVEEGDTLEIVVNKFNALFGCNLSVGLDIDPASTLPDFDYVGVDFVMACLPDSLSYTGSITLNLMMASVPLMNIITNTVLLGLEIDSSINLEGAITSPDLGGISYGVVGTPTAVVGATYFYDQDYTAYSNIFYPLTIGTTISAGTNPISNNILGILGYGDLDGAFRSLWKLSTSTTDVGLVFNVDNAVCVYNGPNTDLSKPTNPAYDFVAEFQLRGDQTAPLGHIYFHYNLAINPLDVTTP